MSMICFDHDSASIATLIAPTISFFDWSFVHSLIVGLMSGLLDQLFGVDGSTLIERSFTQ